MFNPWKQLQNLVAGPPLQAGVVTLIDAGGAVYVELPGGGQLVARGQATVGQTVFVRGGVIEGEAGELPVVTVDI